MKLKSIISLFPLLTVASAQNNPVNNNGRRCGLQVSEIECVLSDSGMPCESLEYRPEECDPNDDSFPSFTANYTFSYANKGSGDIRFLVGINPNNGKEYSFANANTRSVNIKRGQLLKEGQTKTFKVRRTVFPCKPKIPGRPKFRFVGEHRMNGFVVGFPNRDAYKCNAGDFYSHNFKVESYSPSVTPSSVPSGVPKPSAKPTVRPSKKPSEKPSKRPSLMPSSKPTERPSKKPSAKPTVSPSAKPTDRPSKKPSAQPSVSPSVTPSARPTVRPSVTPSVTPSAKPTVRQSKKPSAQPSKKPSAKPTVSPKAKPSVRPSMKPSSQPSSEKPSAQPSKNETFN